MSAMRRSKSAAKASSDMEKVFRKFDANGDGRISASELESLLCSLGSNTSRDEVSRMMSEMDKDGDGFIDLHEFVDFHRGSEEIINASGNGVNHELREAFKMYDKDNNGLISARELHTVLKSLGEKVSLKDCSRMISSVDADGDGHVNFDEFKKMMR